MAITTGAVSSVSATVELSLTGTSAWTNLSGEATSITVSGGDRASGEGYVFDTDYSVVTWGKKGPIDFQIRHLYTEGTADYVTTLQGYYNGGTPIYMRYCPQGTAAYKYTSSVGKIVNPLIPSADATSADPLAVEYTFRCAYVTAGTA